METKLTSGAKVGYFALGFFVGLIGILISWLINKDKPVSGEAIKFSVIGLVVSIVFLCIITIVFGAAILAAVPFLAAYSY